MLARRSGCSVRAVKTFVLFALLASSTVASADEPKVQSLPKKLGREAKVYVLDKELPSMDKTVPMARPRTVLKDKS
ncbi:MAG: hypothetical protein JWN44_3301 [Myxococcales bacterium]|nr:hypothetical protein [Myxococcales bacterium]